MKHPKQLKPITNFILFYVVGTLEITNPGLLETLKEATGKARFICEFATGPSLI